MSRQYRTTGLCRCTSPGTQYTTLILSILTTVRSADEFWELFDLATELTSGVSGLLSGTHVPPFPELHEEVLKARLRIEQRGAARLRPAAARSCRVDPSASGERPCMNVRSWREFSAGSRRSSLVLKGCPRGWRQQAAVTPSRGKLRETSSSLLAVSRRRAARHLPPRLFPAASGVHAGYVSRASSRPGQRSGRSVHPRYFDSYPSTGPSLFDAQGTSPVTFPTHRPQDEEWPDFIIDLARLERAFFVVYDGPGTEGEHLLDGTDGWPRGRMSPAGDPAHALAGPADSGLPLPRGPVLPRSSTVNTLTCPAAHELGGARWSFFEYVIEVTELTEQQHRVLAALISGMPVAAALGEAGETDPAAALRWTVRWAELGFFGSSPGTDDRSEALAEVSRRRPSPQSKGRPG